MPARIFGLVVLLSVVVGMSCLYAQGEGTEKSGGMLIAQETPRVGISSQTWKALATCEDGETDEMLLVRVYADGSKEYKVMWGLCGLNTYYEAGWVPTSEQAIALALEQKRSQGIGVPVAKPKDSSAK